MEVRPFGTESLVVASAVTVVEFPMIAACGTPVRDSTPIIASIKALFFMCIPPLI